MKFFIGDILLPTKPDIFFRTALTYNKHRLKTLERYHDIKSNKQSYFIVDAHDVENFSK